MADPSSLPTNNDPGTNTNSSTTPDETSYPPPRAGKDYPWLYDDEVTKIFSKPPPLWHIFLGLPPTIDLKRPYDPPTRKPEDEGRVLRRNKEAVREQAKQAQMDSWHFHRRARMAAKKERRRLAEVEKDGRRCKPGSAYSGSGSSRSRSVEGIGKGVARPATPHPRAVGT